MKEGYHIRNYKRYIDDHSISVPKSTKLDRNKRFLTKHFFKSSNTCGSSAQLANVQKTHKTNYSNQSQKQSKTLKKTATTIMKKKD